MDFEEYIKELTMFKSYKRKGTIQMTPWHNGFDMDRVSISKEDLENGSPKKGDMIARNPKKNGDMWLVVEDYFKNNYEEV